MVQSIQGIALLLLGWLLGLLSPLVVKRVRGPRNLRLPDTPAAGEPVSDIIQIQFGSGAQWEAFAARNPVFLERMESLRTALNAIFNRNWESDEPIDRPIFVRIILDIRV